MSVDVIMPQMGESIAEGTLTRWMKKQGEKVARDEPIFEISTDKVDAEIPSPAAGVLGEILVKEGETVAINTVVARIESAGAATGEKKPAAAKQEPATGAAAPSATPGRPAPQRHAEPPRPAPEPGSTRAPAGRRASGDPVDFPSAAELSGAGATLEELRRVRSSPVVRKMAREHNLDIGEIEGTGVGGRVSKRDVEAALRSAGAPARRAPSVVEFPAGERVSVVPMTPIRAKIARHMVLSRQTSAHVTTVFEVDMNRVARLREQHGRTFQERKGVKLTYTPFIVRAAIEGLRAFPIVNASVDGDNVVYKKDVNIGIAVALDGGLIVPVVKNADDLSLSGIAVAVTDLANRARSRKLSPDDVQGGTFTVTNPGVFGSLFGTPIINQPQVAILGVGAIQKRPVVINDAIGIRPMVYLALSFDHRLLDGAIADQFMAHIKGTLEEGRFPDIA